MFIVKRKAEVFRFGLFLALMSAMVYYVSTMVDTWRVSQVTTDTSIPLTMPALPEVMLPSPEGSDYFTEFRLDRLQYRSALAERLKEVMESQGADGEVRKQASQEYLDISRLAGLEDRAESLVRARGFDDALVTLWQGTATVIIRSGSISQSQFHQVLDMVSRVTGVKPAAIQVMTKES